MSADRLAHLSDDDLLVAVRTIAKEERTLCMQYGGHDSRPVFDPRTGELSHYSCGRCGYASREPGPRREPTEVSSGLLHRRAVERMKSRMYAALDALRSR